MGLKKIFTVKPPEEDTIEQNRSNLQELGISTKHQARNTSKFAAYRQYALDHQHDKFYAPEGYEQYAHPQEVPEIPPEEESQTPESASEDKPRSRHHFKGLTKKLVRRSTREKQRDAELARQEQENAIPDVYKVKSPPTNNIIAPKAKKPFETSDPYEVFQNKRNTPLNNDDPFSFDKQNSYTTSSGNYGRKTPTTYGSPLGGSPVVNNGQFPQSNVHDSHNNRFSGYSTASPKSNNPFASFVQDKYAGSVDDLNRQLTNSISNNDHDLNKPINKASTWAEDYKYWDDKYQKNTKSDTENVDHDFDLNGPPGILEENTETNIELPRRHQQQLQLAKEQEPVQIAMAEESEQILNDDLNRVALQEDENVGSSKQQYIDDYEDMGDYGYCNMIQQNEPQTNRFKTFEEVQREEEERQLQEEDEEVEELKQEIKFTKQRSVASTRNTLKMAREAETSGMNALGLLGAQSEQLGNVEKNIDLMKVHNQSASDNVDSLKRLNRNILAVHVKNPFNSKKRLLAKQEKIRNRRLEETMQREHTNQGIINSTKRIENALEQNSKHDPSELQEKYDRRMILERNQKFQFENDDEDDAMEIEIDRNLEQIGQISKRLKKLAVAAGQELDDQQGRLNSIEEDTDNLDIDINLNTHKLASIR
ncbi:hypothetical protein TBLA_0C04250 [Henningerozyma blattae CBS 6284]|uniref:t-SNARE coiled-coil homology domain-containing protein n=1 Tax=Henningerozyma blattae (strain ATCC 34711 / CBS 6284 / DSM 70876 / NBRC 10599 / NRRL Y-10934 / UCD 77-7) TaxID=1071380 RepID=I2H1H3_HENB6|nr:hypothetical protein TBLA_0C04250 [Tetrapisispora blattae CBS 6284]CCH60225.1 hypothetical protein TBLA_0C04250 [Tetrapisispora blattae CBS 6284]